MSAIEKVEHQFWRWPGPLSEAHADISRKDFRAALAEAWEEGRDAGFDTGNEYGQGYEFPVSADNPYAEES
jgi:hypothetical protein